MDDIEEVIAQIAASARLEGQDLDERTRDLMRRQLRGEISVDEAVDELLRKYRRSTTAG